MANYSIYTLGQSQITISGGAVLSGFTQGDGSHLLGRTITLNSNAWTVINIADGGTDTNFSDTDSDQVLNGAQMIYGTSYASGRRIEAEYRLTVRDPSGNTYTVVGVNINEPGYTPTYGTVEGLAFIGTFPPQNTPLTIVATAEGPPNSGGGSTPSGTYATPPCFLRDTLIDTCRGRRPVQALRPGDRIRVLDGGSRPLRMNLSTTLSAAEARRRPELWPIRIEAGALGRGLPSRRVCVSPRHRVLLEGWRAQLYFGEDSVLVAAMHLANGGTIRPVPVRGPVTYHHLVFDSHQIVFSSGLRSESFYPGPEAMQTMPEASRQEFYALFPDLREAPLRYGTVARTEITAREAILLAA